MTQLIKTKIVISHERADKEARNNWNTLCFLLPICIEKIDALKDTNVFNKQLKYHINQALRLMEKETEKHFNSYERHGEVNQSDKDLKPIHSADIYNITAKAYDQLALMLTERQPSEICSIVAIIEKLEKDGVKLTDIEIPYQPLK